MNPSLGAGIGLRRDYLPELLADPARAGWVEAITENFLGLRGSGRGRPFDNLMKIRARLPVALHGVSLSIGTTDPLDRTYLKAVRELARHVEPLWISDHLCFTRAAGINSHDLLPLPYTEEAIRHVVSRVKQVQDFLGTRILLENVSSYLTYEHSEMKEWEFLSEISRRADCFLLLDVNNVHVSSVSHSFDPLEFLAGVPEGRVAQFHLGGPTDHGTYLVDTHDEPVPEAVWALYDQALERFGPVPTLIERDDQMPPYAELLAERDRAADALERICGLVDAARPGRARPGIAPGRAETSFGREAQA